MSDLMVAPFLALVFYGTKKPTNRNIFNKREYRLVKGDFYFNYFIWTRVFIKSTKLFIL